MPTYRYEGWVDHPEADFEDEIEDRIKQGLKHVQLKPAQGPVAFRIYPYSGGRS